MNSEIQVRLAVFHWLAEQKGIYGEVMPREVLAKGFFYKGTHIPLIAPQVIFKPKVLQYPLSITTSPNSPYNDSAFRGGSLEYRYRGTNPNHIDNVGLRKAMEIKLPLVYFLGLTPGKYMATWPVFVTQDNPKDLCFTVAVDDMHEIERPNSAYQTSDSSDGRRAYITASVQVRLHQNVFRERVLLAYKTQCSFCKLKHAELLDAAHIIPDNEPEGKPIIVNGLALCKLHHAAFDSYFIGVSPNYKICVRNDLLDEFDGPMLQYGIKQLHGNTLILPNDKKNHPKQEFLEWRFDRFRKAKFITQ
jgi:putative restriction endonuclease